MSFHRFRSTAPTSAAARRRLFVLIATALFAGAFFVLPGDSPRALMFSGETIPLFIATNPSSVTGGSGSVTVTVQVDRAGGTVLIGATNTQAVNSPSGSWPYSLSFPSGGPTTRQFTISTNTVSSSSQLTLYGCPSGVNPSNPANWTCSTTMTVSPAITPDN